MSFTTAQLERFRQDAELDVAELDVIVDRIALSVVRGQSDYELPEYLTSIRSITYRGEHLTPYSGQELIRSGSTPMFAELGKPREYIFSYRGVATIALYPRPEETIAAPVTSLWENTAIQNGVIIEFYRGPDFTSEVYRIPPILRSCYFEDYIYSRAYEIEGKEQDMAAANFHEKLWQESFKEIKDVVNQIRKCVSYEVRPQIFNGQVAQKHPRLPSNFGKVVS